MDILNSGSIKSEKFSCEGIVVKHKCRCCDFTSDLWVTLKDHFSEHCETSFDYGKTDLKAYSCSNCDFKSYSILVWLSHRHKFTYVSKDNKCRTFRLHALAHHSDLKNKVNHKCNQCSFQTFNSQTLKKHVIRMHTDSPENLSKCCHKTLKGHLRRHMNARHAKSEETKWYECDKCEYKGKRKSNLQKHINRKHSRENLIYYNCSHCSYQTPAKESLRRHIVTRHTDPEEIKWFECSQCGYKAKERNTLQIHIKRKHKHENLVYFECSYCSYKTASKDYLRKHIVVRHTDPGEIKWLECNQCDFKTKIKSYLQKHVNTKHSSETRAQFRCSKCSFKTMSEHMSAQDTEEIQWFPCRHCLHKTTKSNNVNRENLVRFQCTQCSFETASKKSLKRHTVVRHTDPKEIKWYECNQCLHKTKTMKNLRSHYNIRHARENMMQHRCSMCSFKTVYKHNLKNHLNKIHHIDPEEINNLDVDVIAT